MRRIHEFEVAAPSLYDDALLRITAIGPQAVRLAGEIDQSNSQALRRLLGTLLDRALRSHSASAAITVDLASLRFVDVAGAVSLVHAAEEFPSTHHLVLDRMRAAVAGVLGPLCGRVAGRGRRGRGRGQRLRRRGHPRRVHPAHHPRRPRWLDDLEAGIGVDD
jgi:anti-anti-sigma regulatory factor